MTPAGSSLIRSTDTIRGPGVIVVAPPVTDTPTPTRQRVPVEEADMATTQGNHDVQVEARPHPLAIDPRQTAVIVVDMQNDFGAEGGMFARAGSDLSGIRAAVAPTARVLVAARQAGMPVVYLKMGFAADLSDAGGPEAPNRVRHL